MRGSSGGASAPQPGQVRLVDQVRSAPPFSPGAKTTSPPDSSSALSTASRTRLGLSRSGFNRSTTASIL
jgi:hypothetical protein